MYQRCRTDNPVRLIPHGQSCPSHPSRTILSVSSLTDRIVRPTGRLFPSDHLTLFEDDEPVVLNSTNSYASPVAEAGRVYCDLGSMGTGCVDTATTTVIQAGRQFQRLAENRVADKIMATPAVVDQSLILRTATHTYRIDP